MNVIFWSVELYERSILTFMQVRAEIQMEKAITVVQAPKITSKGRDNA